LSSILKALKKLDNNSPQQMDGENHSPQIDTKQTIQKRIRGIWIFQRFFQPLFASVILFGFIWVILKYNPLLVKKLFPDAVLTVQHTEAVKIPPVSVSGQHQSPPEKKKQIATAQETFIIPEKKIPSALPRNEMHVLKESREFDEQADFRKATESVKKELTEKIVKSVGKVKIEIEKPEKIYAPPVLPKKKEDIPVIADPEKEIEHKKGSVVQAPLTDDELAELYESGIEDKKDLDVKSPIENSKEVSAANEKSKEKKNSEQQPEATEVKDDSRFKLQALVWSADPESCFVVINDRITRVGNSIVNGVILDSIGEDYVIIQEGDKKWKQIFQMK